MTFTHIFSNATKEIRPLDDAPAAVREVAFSALGFKLLDIDRADLTRTATSATQKAAGHTVTFKMVGFAPGLVASIQCG